MLEKEGKLKERVPGYIQTEGGFIFKIEGYKDGNFIIDQEPFVTHYNINEGIFYGIEDGKMIARDIEPKQSQVYKLWLKNIKT